MSKLRQSLEDIITSFPHSPTTATTPSTTLFSVPASIILNRRLLSPRGGIIPPTSQSEDTLRFKLFINSNPSSVRYGLTLQISALRDMSKEHNIDQISEHQAYIFFPTSSFVHYDCMTPNRDGISDEEKEETEGAVKQAREIGRMMGGFWVKHDASFEELRHLMFKCTGASVDSSHLPKLRTEALEGELKRIFGTMKTANEIEDAVLEVDCLLPAMKGATDAAVWMFRDAAEDDLEVREAKTRAAEQKAGTREDGHKAKNSSASTTKERSANMKLTNWREKMDAAKAESEGKERTPKKLVVPAIIDGKFVSLDKTLWQKEKGPPAVDSKEGTPNKTSLNKYLHPHSFDSANNQRSTAEPQSGHNDKFDSEDTSSVG